MTGIGSAPPDGFKQTEIGLIPEEWDVTELGDVCQKTKQRTPQTDEEFEYIDVSSVSNQGFKIIGSTRYRGSNAPSRARKPIQADDVLFATVRPALKRVAMVPEYLDKQVCSTAFCVVRADPELSKPAFLYHLLLTNELTNRIAERQRGSSYPAVTDSDILNQKIPLPPLPEQRAIAHVFSEIQAAAQAQAAIAGRARELKRALMAKLFTGGLRGEPLKETEIGVMPERWEVPKFADVVEIAKGQVDPTREPYKYMIHVGPENIQSETGRLSAMKTNEDCGIISGNYHFTAEDVLYSKIRPYLNKVALPTFEGTCSADVYPLRPNKGRLVREFLFQFLLSGEFKTRAVSFQDRTGIPKINRNQLGSIPLPIPSLQEQRDIARILQTVDAKITVAERKRLGLEELFRAMLGGLMTGRMRAKALL